jgi:serine/threonine protein kinase
MSMRPRLPDYQVLRRIGGGAYGEVCLARNLATGVFRAVKFVRREDFGDDRPFQREFEGMQAFESISRLHPSQLGLFHVGRNEAGGYFYYVMELADPFPGSSAEGAAPFCIEGESAATPGPSLLGDEGNEAELEKWVRYEPHTLRAELKEGALLPDRVVALGMALTEALAHLHEHGLIHRDIKPSNIIFVQGRPKLADIGLVTGVSDEKSIVGTEGYLAPEGPGTPRGDIYGLGKVLYEALTGLDRRQFPELPEAVRHRPNAALIFELNAIVVKACAADPALRYGTAREFFRELEAVRSGLSIRRYHGRERVWRRVRHWAPWATAAFAVSLLMLTLLRKGREPEGRSSNQEVNRLVAAGWHAIRFESQDRIGLGLTNLISAIRLDPLSIPAQFGIFEVQMLRGDFEGVRASAVTLRRLAPDSVEDHLASDFILWYDWHFAEALNAAERTTKLRAYSGAYSDFARARAHLAYGFMLLQSGFPDLALEQYRLAEKVTYDDATIQHHLGHPYFVKRDFTNALAHYDKSIRLEPNHANGHLWRGRTLEEMGRVNEALDAYETGERCDGRLTADRKAWYEKLRRAAAQGGLKAVRELTLNAALEAKQPNLYDIATLYAQLGQKAKAYQYLREACQKRAFHQGLLFDLCWDHDDPEFLAIARGIGLLR